MKTRFAIIGTLLILLIHTELFCGDTLRLRNIDQASYVTDYLIIENGTRLDISRFPNVSIKAKRTSIGDNCQIIGIGRDGNSKPAASNGVSADQCSDAAGPQHQGQHGAHGDSGANGSSISIDFGIIEKLGYLTIDVHGGRGGNGGNGGNGGKGGRADCDRCSGKQGGRGGDGGNGGRGGDGGGIILTYCNTVGIQPGINVNFPKESIKLINQGGNSGGPGEAGAGGLGGDGRDGCGVWPARFSRGPGIQGSSGRRGVALGDGSSRLPNINGFDCRTPAPDTRIALVICNSKYKKPNAIFSELSCPADDYKNVLNMLSKCGFEDKNIIKKLDATYEEMYKAIAKTQELIKAHPSSSLVIYYTGHGFEEAGQNYLAAVDAEGPKKRARQRNQVRDYSIALADLFELSKTNKDGLNILILDACRVSENQRDLARQSSPAETYTIFSTSAFNNAWCLEGGKGSKFTSALLDAINGTRLEFVELIRTVQSKLEGGQLPSMDGLASKTFFFKN